MSASVASVKGGMIVILTRRIIPCNVNRTGSSSGLKDSVSFSPPSASAQFSLKAF